MRGVAQVDSTKNDMPARRLVGFAFAFALHLGAMAFLVWLSMPARDRGRQAGRSVAPQPIAQAPKPISPEEAVRQDLDRHLPKPPDVRVWGFTFDLRKVRSRWSGLFPFVTAPPRFDVDAASQRASSSRGFVFVDPDRAMPAEPPAKPALILSPSAIQRLVDGAWSRRERWSRFATFVNLANAYHPDGGRLPAVIRAYVTQNMLQPYEEMSLPDPSRWAMLVLAADDQDYLDFASAYVRDHPGTRGATEMLFLVDALMEGNGSALGILMRTRPRRDLQWTYQENPDAFWLFDSLRDYYGSELDKRGLKSAGAVARYYEDRRLDLLATVLRQTPAGYRAGDARFVMGKIHWSRGDRRVAIREWRQMQVVANDAFAATSARIAQALERLPAGVEEPDPPTVAGIEAVLAAERQAWATFEYDRLRQFGHGPYTF
jgi:hypothetical protein